MTHIQQTILGEMSWKDTQGKTVKMHEMQKVNTATGERGGEEEMSRGLLQSYTQIYTNTDYFHFGERQPNFVT